MSEEAAFEIGAGVRASFGVGARSRLPRRVRDAGGRRALLVTDPGLVRAGVVEPLRALLAESGCDVQVFAEVSANPSTDDVARGVSVLGTGDDAVVVALGGGSVIDAAKAIALVAPNGGSALDYPFGCKPARPARPVVVVPTTAGTGSETNAVAVITDVATGRKVLLAHASTLPVCTLLDPELTLGVPPSVTACTGFDALTHALEACASTRSNPYSDALAGAAIARILRALPRAVEHGDDLPARSQLLVASHLAGLAFGNAGLGLCHALGHPLSARLGVAHGQTLAVFCAPVLRFNAEVAPERYHVAARALDVSGAEARARAEEVARAVEALATTVGLARRAGDLGVTPDLLPALVADALHDPLLLTTPRAPSAADVERLYREAL